jgi:plastocyanin
MFNQQSKGRNLSPHNVVFSDAASPEQATGTFRPTFDQPGTYTYVCTVHAFMEGVVIVSEYAFARQVEVANP